MKITASALSLNVADVAASAAYATEHLGFGEAMERRRLRLPRPPGRRLQPDLPAHRAAHLQAGAAARAAADGLLVAFVVEDVDGEYARLQAEGVAITTPIETEPWGERYFQVTDPNGVVYQLVQWVTAPGRVRVAGGRDTGGRGVAAGVGGRGRQAARRAAGSQPRAAKRGDTLRRSVRRGGGRDPGARRWTARGTDARAGAERAVAAGPAGGIAGGAAAAGPPRSPPAPLPATGAGRPSRPGRRATTASASSTGARTAPPGSTPGRSSTSASCRSTRRGCRLRSRAYPNAEYLPKLTAAIVGGAPPGVLPASRRT